MKLFKITPYTSERELMRIAAHSYVLQGSACVLAACEVALAGYGLSLGDMSGNICAAVNIAALLFSFRAFNSLGKLRAELFKLIKLKRQAKL